MISNLGQVMLYVDNQESSLDFWINKLGFVLLSDDDNGSGLRWVEIAAHHNAQTSIVLHNKAFVAKIEPDMNLDTPALMFFCDDAEKLRDQMLQKGIKVGDLVNMPFGKGRVFNFADLEENYFAVLEKAG